jgi:hypothetical protein
MFTHTNIHKHIKSIDKTRRESYTAICSPNSRRHSNAGSETEQKCQPKYIIEGKEKKKKRPKDRLNWRK